MIDPSLKPRRYQDQAADAVWAQWNAGVRSTLVVSATGCHAIGAKVLRHDGSEVNVEHVACGDTLLGPDGMPRTVLNLCRGVSPMFDVVPTKGEKWTVSENHILTIQHTRKRTGMEQPALVDVPLREYLASHSTFKHTAKQVRVRIDEFGGTRKVLEIDPYFLGVLIGDGSLSRGVSVSKPDIDIFEEVKKQCEIHRVAMRVDDDEYHMVGRKRGGENLILNRVKSVGLFGSRAGDKFVPIEYKTGDRNVRLGVLAGLLDTDGHYHCGVYDYISKSEQLSNDVAFIARSLGLAAYVNECVKSCQNNFTGTYWRVSISGDCSVLPLKITRKIASPRLQKKDVLRTGFTVVATGRKEEYYGFRVDGDSRYLMSDFTVTHNSGKSVVVAGVVNRMPEDHRFLYVVHRDSLANQAVRQFRRWTGRSVELEMKQHGRDKTHGGEAQVVVASVQSMRGRRWRYGKNEFDVVATDESHRYADNTWADTVNYFEAPHRCGFTATWMRHDGVELIGPGCEFQNVAFAMPIEVAIPEGWIVPFRWRMELCRDVDIDAIKRNGNDLSPASVERELNRDPVVEFMVRKMIAVADGRQGMMFCAGVKQVEAVEREFRRQGATAVSITGKTPDGVRYYRDQDFKQGRAQFMVGAEIFIEGYDHPGIAVVGMGSLTMSWTRYVQMAGRGSRTVGEPEGTTAGDRCLWIKQSEKPVCTILDFVGNSRHKLAKGIHLLGGQFSAEEDEEAVRLVADMGQEYDIAEVAETARRNVAARPKAVSGVEFDFRDTAAEKRFTFHHGADPFEVLELDRTAPGREVPEEETYGAGWRAAREFLLESKIPEHQIGQLSQYDIVYLRDQLVARAKAGLCSFPQANLLFGLGYDCGAMTALMAKRKIGAARGTGQWLRPVQDGPNLRFHGR